jgi:hypothetical protein
MPKQNLAIKRESSVDKKIIQATSASLPIMTSISYRFVDFEREIAKFEDLQTFGPTLISASSIMNAL